MPTGKKKKETTLEEFHRTQYLRRGEAHGNYPLILFISGRGYITARWGKEPEVVKGRERAPLWRFRAKPSARHSFAEEAKVANYRRRLNASHYDGSYSAPFLLDSRRGVKVYRPLRKSSGFPTLRALFPVPPFPALFFHDLFSTHQIPIFLPNLFIYVFTYLAHFSRKYPFVFSILNSEWRNDEG